MFARLPPDGAPVVLAHAHFASVSAPDDAEGPAREIQIMETLRSMRQLVSFCPDSLAEAFANHFSRRQVLELLARLEDAKLAMEADQPPAKPARAAPGGAGRARAAALATASSTASMRAASALDAKPASCEFGRRAQTRLAGPAAQLR